MIGKSLSERHTLPPLEEAIAEKAVARVLAERAGEVVAVRKQGATMIAFVVVDADDASVRFCRALGLSVKRGGTGVFGLDGSDAARIVPPIVPSAERLRDWFVAPCGARETKVVLAAGGIAFLSLSLENGAVAVRFP